MQIKLTVVLVVVKIKTCFRAQNFVPKGTRSTPVLAYPDLGYKPREEDGDFYFFSVLMKMSEYFNLYDFNCHSLGDSKIQQLLQHQINESKARDYSLC